MASTFVLKRKTFAEDQNQQKKGSGLGKKLAIGAGTIGTAALSFYGARKGAFGNNIMKSANNLYGRAGGWLSRNGATNMGNSMMKGASKDYEKATTELLKKNAKDMGKTITDQQAVQGAQKATKMRQQQWEIGTDAWKTNRETFNNFKNTNPNHIL